jgi:hypothetical protein
MINNKKPTGRNTLSIFTRKATVGSASIVDTLAAKGGEKLSASSGKNALADKLLAQAAEARAASQVDAAHAEAISKAVDILDEAGVSI